MHTSYEKLRADLENIGVRPGDVLVVHSSLKSMGHVEGGAECVIAALTDAIGPEGTLILPAFTFAIRSVTLTVSTFCVVEEGALVGSPT